mgnify:CR=1 FL=1
MQKALVWLRRDLRLYDNAALHHALKQSEKVWLTFIFDTDILKPLLKGELDANGLKHDRRVDFIWQGLQQIDDELRKQGGGLIVRFGKPTECIPEIAKELGVDTVFTNHDYEPSAIERDATVKASLEKMGIHFESFKDQVIFEKKEILTNSNTVFSIFTPYKNNWLKTLQEKDLAAYDCNPKPGQLAAIPKKLDQAFPSLESMGFCPTGIESYLPPGSEGGQAFLKDFLQRIDQYQVGRDFPAIKGVSYLSTHLRFGMLSIRGLVREAHRRMLAGSMGATIWLSELIWRDFYFMILSNHPRLAKGASFKPDYDNIAWESGATAKKLFTAWCEGKTGYPLVDAAMHQLNQSGYMHNRLRMVVASFLTKDLGIDWRWGEAYFAEHLNDFELSSNNGGWQWASGSGCDAAPYFRVFNPALQTQKFDAKLAYVRKWVPEFQELNYPKPIVVHEQARERVLAAYAKALKPA